MRTISVRDARANFADLLGRVYYTQQPIIVEKKGKAVAVVVSPEQFKQLDKIKTAGLGTVESQKNASAQSLLKLAEIGRKYKTGEFPKTSAVEEIDKMWQSWGKGNE